MRSTDPRWNLNIHCHRVVLDAIPAGARMALDVGCGDGILSFDLADRGLEVLGIDPDAATLERAGRDPRLRPSTNLQCIGLFDEALTGRTFDVVASVAMLHHVDTTLGLRRMRELVGPGGVLAIVGFATSSAPDDVARALAGSAYRRWRTIRGQYWEHTAPICWPPAMNMRQMEALAAAELPGAAFTKLLSNRYGIVWRRGV